MDWPDTRDQAHPCRPTISCTADITAPGTLEIEEGTLFSHSLHANEATFPVLLKQTFTRLLQLQVGANGYTVLAGKSDANYLDNVYFGPKLHLLDQSTYVPSVAVGAQLGLPTFRAYGYARHDDAFFTAFASKDIGPVHVDWNVGAYVWGIETSDATQLFTALALSTAVSSVVGVAVEGYGFTNAAPFASHDGGARAAVGFTARPWLIVDAGGDVGFFPSVRSCSLFLGLTVIPVVFWRPKPG
jgi:hypothetical protein